MWPPPPPRRLSGMMQRDPARPAPARPPPPPAPPPFEASCARPDGGPTFALGVSHCPWIPARAAHMAELRPALLTTDVRAYREETERAPNHVWSRRLWGWAAGQGVTHTAFLQDDLRVSPRLWPILLAIATAHPLRVLALLSNHPMAPRAYADGHPGYLCGETLGAGYVVPTVLLGAFLEWRDAQPTAWLAATCEDFVLTAWLGRTGRRAFAPCPGPIDTARGFASTNPTISYPYRHSALPWDDPRVAADLDLTHPDTWRRRGPLPDYGPSVSNDSRLARGPFTDSEIKAAAAADPRKPPP